MTHAISELIAKVSSRKVRGKIRKEVSERFSIISSASGGRP